jgi:hypothetical protein
MTQRHKHAFAKLLFTSALLESFRVSEITTNEGLTDIQYRRWERSHIWGQRNTTQPVTQITSTPVYTFPQEQIQRRTLPTGFPNGANRIVKSGPGTPGSTLRLWIRRLGVRLSPGACAPTVTWFAKPPNPRGRPVAVDNPTTTVLPHSGSCERSCQETQRSCIATFL